jgi:hypothetical protein
MVGAPPNHDREDAVPPGPVMGFQACRLWRVRHGSNIWAISSEVICSPAFRRGGPHLAEGDGPPWSQAQGGAGSRSR